MLPEVFETYSVQRRRIRYILILATIAFVALVVNAGAELFVRGETSARSIADTVDHQISRNRALELVLNKPGVGADETSATLLERFPNPLEAQWDRTHRHLMETLRNESSHSAAPLASSFAGVSAAFGKLKELLVADPSLPVAVEDFEVLLTQLDSGLTTYTSQLQETGREIKTGIYDRETKLNFLILIPLGIGLACIVGLLVEGLFVLRPLLSILKNAHDVEDSVALPTQAITVIRSADTDSATDDDAALKSRFLANLGGSVQTAARAVVEHTRKLASGGLSPEQSRNVDVILDSS